MNNLIRLIGNRIIWLPVMIIGVTVLVFFIMSLSPIDPAYSVLGENATEAQAQAYREQNGLNDPIIVQYGRFMLGLFQGNLGTYGASQMSVTDRVLEALPVTLQLTFMGLIFGVVVAMILGVISALYRDRWPDQIIRVFSIACIATPSFWLAVLLILAFQGILPALRVSVIKIPMCAAGYGRTAPTPGQQFAFGAFLEFLIIPVCFHLADPHVRDPVLKDVSHLAVLNPAAGVEVASG